MARLSYLDLGQPIAAALIAQHATAADQDAAARYLLPPRQRQSLAARALLRAVLGPRPGGWPLIRDPDGAPRLDGPGLPFVSLSHSAGMVACAAAETRVGVDIEAHRPQRRFAAIADAIFPPGETAAASRDMPSFYRFWTLREALAKASGIALAELAPLVDLAPFGTGAIRVAVAGTDWTLGHWALPEGYSLAVALDAGDLPEPCRTPDLH